MEKYKIDFKEALKILANEVGVDLANTSQSSFKKSTENKTKYLHIMNLISFIYSIEFSDFIHFIDTKKTLLLTINNLFK